MTDTHIPAIPEVTDNDVFITRAFNAPREVVWKFWTEPEYLAQWFGPAEVHIDPETVVVDLREGGQWDLDMVDNADGTHYPMRATLRVVDPPAYLEGVASGAGGSEEDGPAITNVAMRVWFHDHGDKTRVTIHQGPFSAEFRDMTSAGWESSFLKLDTIFADGAA